MAHAGGRPLSNLDLPDSWGNDVLELYMQGGSDQEVKGLIYQIRGSFSNDLWDRWLKDEPEFSETIKNGRMLSESWWHKSGRKNLENKDFSFTGWYMNMKNRFGWADNQKVESTGSILLHFDKTDEQIGSNVSENENTDSGL